LLLYAADWAWFGAQGRALLVASLLTLSLAIGVLVLAGRVGGGLASPAARMSVAAAAFTLFWAASGYNLSCSVCHANTAVLLFAFASLGLLARYAHGRARRPRDLVLCLGAAALCSASMGQGVAIWPALVGVAWTARLPRRALAAVVLAAAGIGGAIAASITGQTGALGAMSPVEAVLLRPHVLARVAATLLGVVPGALAREVGIEVEPVGQQYGVAGLFGLVLLAGHAHWIRRNSRVAGTLDWLGVGAMAVAAAAAAGIGATRLFTLGFSEAYQQRFLDWSGLFWAGALLSLGAFAARAVRPRAAFAATAAIALGSTALLLAALDAFRGPMLHARDRSADACLAVFLGVAGPVELQRFHRGTRAEVDELVARLRAGRKSLFAEERLQWIGERVDSVLAVSGGGRCRGAIDPLPPARAPEKARFRIAGWAWDARADAPPRSVVLADLQGRVRGLANRRPAAAWRGNEQADWRGWVRVARHQRRYQAYGVLDDGSACRIAEEPGFSAERRGSGTPAAAAPGP
jgi:hypothetical protein